MFAPEGRPFILAVGLPAAAAWSWTLLDGGPWVTTAAGALTVLTVFVVFFFRDPPRMIPADPGAVLAPAHGRVVEIVEVDEPTYMGGRCRRISIFLSIFDVHVQTAPVTGTVEHRDYRTGGYAIAWKPKASEENEQASLGIRTPAGPVLVRQIAGLIARRIVTDPAVGDGVHRGRRIGLIRFGSRVDTFVPLEWRVVCSVGDRAASGETTIALLPGSGGSSRAPGRKGAARVLSPQPSGVEA